VAVAEDVGPTRERKVNLAPLEDVLAYQNDDVVIRFSTDNDISFDDSQEIFLETKRWLWICAKRKIALDRGEIEFFNIPLFNEAFIIDSMWHTFLLFSEDYLNFCQKYFGFYVHHYPKTHKETLKWRERIEKDPEGARLERRESLKKVYGYLYDELGPETLLKWCEDFPNRFKDLSP